MALGGQRHAPAALPPRKTQYPLYRRMGGPQGRSERVRKISTPRGFDPRTVQPVFILSLSLPSGVFPSGVPSTILYTVLFFAIRATCPAYLISHDYITAVVQYIHGDQHKYEYSSLLQLFLNSSALQTYRWPSTLLYIIYTHIQRVRVSQGKEYASIRKANQLNVL
jgi:hypothetical protein